MKIALLLFALLLGSLTQATAQTLCVKNLNGLTLQQFDSQYLRLVAENDRQLKKSDHYVDIYDANGTRYAIARVLNSNVDVTRVHSGVLSYTVCKLNQVITSGPTILVTEQGKTYMRTSIYIIVYYY